MDTNKPIHSSEYIFSAAEMQKYLNDFAAKNDISQYDLSIQALIQKGSAAKVFELSVQGILENRKRAEQFLEVAPLPGCPRPPSC